MGGPHALRARGWPPHPLLRANGPSPSSSSHFRRSSCPMNRYQKVLTKKPTFRTFGKRASSGFVVVGWFSRRRSGPRGLWGAPMPSGPVVGPRTRSSERTALVLVLVAIFDAAVVQWTDIKKFLQKNQRFARSGNVLRQGVRVVCVLCS